MLLGRDQILAIRTLKKELVPVHEWGGEVYVRVMTCAENDMLTELVLEHEARTGNNRLPHLKAVMAVLTVCDEDGGRLFAMADVDMLLSKEGTALSRLFDVARRLNGLSPDDDGESQEKNFETTQSDASGLSLPSPSVDAPLPNGSRS